MIVNTFRNDFVPILSHASVAWASKSCAAVGTAQTVKAMAKTNTRKLVFEIIFDFVLFFFDRFR
jgi:hypothetical protein